MTGIGLPEDPEGDIPPPPFQVSISDYYSIGVTFDPDAARQLLPSSLQPAPGFVGGFSCYVAPHGWGITPFNSTFTWIEIEGFDSADGSKGRYQPFGYYSDKAGRYFSRTSRNYFVGDTRCRNEDRLATAVGGLPDQPLIRMRMRSSGKVEPLGSGIHYYLNRGHDGGLRVFPVPYSGAVSLAEPLSVEIIAPMGHPLHLMKPRSLNWAFTADTLIATLGVNYKVSEFGTVESDDFRTSLITLLSRMGRGGILLTADARVLHMNEPAAKLLSDGLKVIGNRLRCSDRVAQDRLDSLLSDPRKASPTPVLIPRPSGRQPLLAQAMPVGQSDLYSATPPSQSPPATILLLTDPETQPEGDITKTLELLGLTPAEARIAALVGAGHSPRETAELLGITEGTTRTQLNRIYDKLGISRQSGLAKLVGRLQGLGT